MRGQGRAVALYAVLLAAAAGMHEAEAAQTWRGLDVAPERRRGAIGEMPASAGRAVPRTRPARRHFP